MGWRRAGFYFFVFGAEGARGVRRAAAVAQFLGLKADEWSLREQDTELKLVTWAETQKRQRLDYLPWERAWSLLNEPLVVTRHCLPSWNTRPSEPSILVVTKTPGRAGLQHASVM